MRILISKTTAYPLLIYQRRGARLAKACEAKGNRICAKEPKAPLETRGWQSSQWAQAFLLIFASFLF